LKSYPDGARNSDLCSDADGRSRDCESRTGLSYFSRENAQKTQKNVKVKRIGKCQFNNPHCFSQEVTEIATDQPKRSSTADRLGRTERIC
jgi:hypothetical protein